MSSVGSGNSPGPMVSNQVAGVGQAQNTAASVFGEIQGECYNLNQLVAELQAKQNDLNDLRKQREAFLKTSPKEGDFKGGFPLYRVDHGAYNKASDAWKQKLADFDQRINKLVGEIHTKGQEIEAKKKDIEKLENDKLPRCLERDRAAADKLITDTKRAADAAAESAKATGAGDDDATMQQKKKAAKGMVSGGSTPPGTGIGAGVP